MPQARNLIRFLACLLWLSGFALGTHGQAPSATNRYEFRSVHDPNGTGKFYLGREIAQVMGHEGADWLERPERAQQENSDRLVEELQLKPGEVVADIGCGTGYYSRRMAQRVGPQGKVLAVDIQPEMLDLLSKRMAQLGITNVVPVLGKAADPNLPSASIDLALLVDVYHEFDSPYEMMAAICRALKPGGRVALVEFRAEDPNVPIKALHKMSEAQVRKEMALQPLTLARTDEVLPWQHILVFAKAANGSFADDFKGKLGEGWAWLREEPAAWRVGAHGLEVRVEPGNLWGSQNDARNVLWRLAPDLSTGPVSISAEVESHPTHQYEQVDLAWYYDDSNMVKLGLELVDGKLSVVMGREEQDQTHTISITPVSANTAQLRFLASLAALRGQFRIPGDQSWRDAGQCNYPVTKNDARISLQFYQGPDHDQQWARVTGFRIRR